MSGVTYDTKTNGAARVSQLASLDFASDVTAPSANRHARWDVGTKALIYTDPTGTVEAADLPSYEMLVNVKSVLYEKYIRPIRGDNNNEMFHVFMHPRAFMRLKLDDDFITNVRNSMPRAKDNQLFSGTSNFDSVFVDGMAIHTHRHVFNTTGLTSSVDKWGASNTVDGCRVLFCGAQSLGMADIGPGFWVEKEFDYENQPGVSYGKNLWL